MYVRFIRPAEIMAQPGGSGRLGRAAAGRGGRRIGSGEHKMSSTMYFCPTLCPEHFHPTVGRVPALVAELRQGGPILQLHGRGITSGASPGARDAA